MKLKLKLTDSVAELIIQTENAAISEDLATYKNGNYTVDEAKIEELIHIANDLNNFNGQNDLYFVKKIMSELLSDSEKEELIEWLNYKTT